MRVWFDELGRSSSCQFIQSGVVCVWFVELAHSAPISLWLSQVVRVWFDELGRSSPCQFIQSGVVCVWFVCITVPLYAKAVLTICGDVCLICTTRPLHSRTLPAHTVWGGVCLVCATHPLLSHTHTHTHTHIHTYTHTPPPLLQAIASPKNTRLRKVSSAHTKKHSKKHPTEQAIIISVFSFSLYLRKKVSAEVHGIKRQYVLASEMPFLENTPDTSC